MLLSEHGFIWLARYDKSDKTKGESKMEEDMKKVNQATLVELYKEQWVATRHLDVLDMRAFATIPIIAAALVFAAANNRLLPDPLNPTAIEPKIERATRPSTTENLTKPMQN